MVSFRGLFLSESQRQVESEARNIGLAHTIRDLITGSSHEAHVDAYQKNKAVKALQKAKPQQVNELITILKAMPDPTVVEFKTVHDRDPSKQHPPTEVPTEAPTETPSEATGEPSPPEKTSDGEEGTTTTAEGGEGRGDGGKVDAEPEVIKAPSSWWAVSFSSLLSSITSTTSTEKPPMTTTTTTVTTFTVTEDKAVSVTEAAVETSKSDPAAPAEAEVVGAGTGAEAGAVEVIATSVDKGTITKTTTSTTTVAEPANADKSVIVSTLNSIKKQIIALGKAPPTNAISAYTFWWGYEIYVPHNCMSQLQRVTNTSQIFFGFLSGAVTGIPGLAALVPLTRIISAWVGLQWAVIQAEDFGNGVILSATWVLPVALAPRSWDHPGNEGNTQPVSAPKRKQKRIKDA
ncbi:hypothetical protein BGZ80_010375 [Entomortierella chlamydospora]|uniref:Uncharacterized protein n=1 Tax=Entomortierella chlamydospora TaxID=101097 RepID=A0A9P6MVG1_9FUNG|nr:hypothetical protein BGZ79_010209 [Entomortierella chlamydospora]KAG0014550.1 hypothetical protein BGZ80_010375 [Entomortierella chlamydospora]